MLELLVLPACVYEAMQMIDSDQPAAWQRHLLLQNAEFMNPAHINVNTSLGHTSVAHGISKLKVASCMP
jgi:hypothetical protein